MNDARLWHPWLRINRVLRVMLHTRFVITVMCRISRLRRASVCVLGRDAEWMLRLRHPFVSALKLAQALRTDRAGRSAARWPVACESSLPSTHLRHRRVVQWPPIQRQVAIGNVGRSGRSVKSPPNNAGTAAASGQIRSPGG